MARGLLMLPGTLCNSGSRACACAGAFRLLAVLLITVACCWGNVKNPLLVLRSSLSLFSQCARRSGGRVKPVIPGGLCLGEQSLHAAFALGCTNLHGTLHGGHHVIDIDKLDQVIVSAQGQPG